MRVAVIPVLMVIGILGAGAIRSEESSERKRLQEQREKDLAFQQSAPGSNFRGGVRSPIPNVELPEQVPAKSGELTFFADFDRAGPEGVPLFLVNRTGKEIGFASQDHDLYLKLEFQDKNGRWIRAQNHIRSWCGNSYYPVTLPTGQHYSFLGYLPEHGTPAKVRYRSRPGQELVSNVGEGRYLEADRTAASLDSIAAEEIPAAISAILSGETYPPVQGKITPSRYLAALELLSRSSESAYFRRAAERYLSSLERPPPEAAAIRGILETEWPADKETAALFRCCLSAVGAGDPELSTKAMRAHPELSWRVIGYLLKPPYREETGDAWPMLVAKAFEALPDSLTSASAEEVGAAAGILSHWELSNEHVTNEALLEWVQLENLSVTRICSGALSKREQYESLAKLGLRMDPQRQLIVLNALGTGGGYHMNYRNPSIGVEKQFWEHCARTQPLNTVQTLFYSGVGGAGQRNRFNLTLYDPLRAFLVKEAELGATAPDKVANVDEGYPVAQVVQFVGGWQREKDIPVFELLLKHPGYQKSWSQDSETEQWLENRRYRVRQEAKQVLLSMGISVDEDLVMEEKVPVTELPEFLRSQE